MPEVDQAYKESPYGWPQAAVAALRWVLRVLGSNPAMNDIRASALEFLDGGLNRPSGPH